MNTRLARLKRSGDRREESFQTGGEPDSGDQSTPSDSGSPAEDTELTIEDLIKNILDAPAPDGKSSVEGLTDDQKAAFLYWADQLALTNPRQLRRMHNSYNLLRKVVGRPDYSIEVQPPANRSFDYLWMLVLMVLEFINAEEDGGMRRAYRGLIRCSVAGVMLPQAAPEALMRALRQIEGYFESYLEQQTDTGRTDPDQARLMLFEWVEQFVLPAIDGKGIELA